ncbi:MAG: glycosyl transferase [Flavobacteriales bacterium]|nr:glycosyl transferase [Flavobacteriales bacterium]MCB9190385.1 glycosyl transferase [Flavobacteriales bacterium]MCB9204634.1 glycosyl transferase [Flavobacteriales bacterium]
MRILYAIQGTGNGHLSRSMEIIPHLQKRGEVDVLLSGNQCELKLPFDVRYRFHGLSFIFGEKGGINFTATYKNNRTRRFMREVNSLDVTPYDLIISDFEPVSAWACILANKRCIGLSNQASILTEGAPVVESGDMLGKFILQNYAPVSDAYGFHFQRYNPSIFTPIIRKQVRDLKTSDKGHYLVYLPAHSDERIVKALKRYPNIEWQVFSKHGKEGFIDENVWLRPINNEQYLESLANCTGLLCAAGFGATTEALFLGKKLCIIPMKKQFEQQCNALALSQMGIPVVKSLKKKWHDRIQTWLEEENPIRVNYPDNAELIVSTIIRNEILKDPNGQEKRLIAGFG